MTEYKVLFVDDEPELLKSFRRRFRGTFDIDLAESGEEGLSAIQTRGPYAVVVSDYRMPVMDGIEFLSRVSDIAPDTVRIMLTGQADLQTAIKAVNEGRVFRFLTKPCPPEDLDKSVAEGIRFFKLTEAERELIGLKKWRQSLEDMIVAFIRVIEMRDPYTAGHQQKVTRLASAMALEMGLTQTEQEGIRMAATVHDIGKIYVPAEFLNRPGRLTEVEFAVIKAHPQVGYDILKNIDFEYPIAQIVLQHHERLDGSGYPQGLAGDDILDESRIIMVADVVDAMISHRPYRPGLGLDAALEEIERNQGRYYDPDVVAACIHLLRDKKMVMEP